MTKLLKPLCIAALILPGLAVAAEPQTTSVEKVKAAIGPTLTQAQVNNGQVTLKSPRTGISYSFPNPDQRPMVLETQKIAAANSANVNRIVAANPALSVASQETAKQALLNESAQMASN
jgi:hypothetical protein